jgi:hypothetical protein
MIRETISQNLLRKTTAQKVLLANEDDEDY